MGRESESQAVTGLRGVLGPRRVQVSTEDDGSLQTESLAIGMSSAGGLEAQKCGC